MTESNLADKNYQIAMFMEVSGLDFESASSTLSIHDYNLDQAMNFHLERSLNENDDGNVSTASTSSTAILPQNGSSSAASTSTSCTSQKPHFSDADTNEAEDNVRAPIPPKREQMILPDEDNFRFRKRRAQQPRSVCPLRNFELEGRMQEARLHAAASHSFASNNLGAEADNEKDDDEDEENIDEPFRSAKASRKRKTRGVVFPQTIENQFSANSKFDQGAPSRLSDLYRPPADISFCGSFQAARDHAKEQNRWLIVNLQDNADFNCQVLNRDVWSNEKLRKVLRNFFVFWQVATDNAEGHRYQIFYSVEDFPYVGIIDPRTGEEKLSHKNGFKSTVAELMLELQDYLLTNSPHPNVDLASSEEIAIAEIDFMRTDSKPSSTTTRDAEPNESPFKNKRKKLEPLSLSEQEQIELAIGNSLREVKWSGDDGESDDNASDFCNDEEDDDGDFEFTSYSDDERSTQSLAVTDPKSQPVIGNVTESLADSIVPETTTYESYLGPKNDATARIQLRLPDGNRSILEWPCSTKIKALKLYIPAKYPEIIADGPYKVICPFGAISGATQPSNILDLDDALTLKEANLYPTVILHLRNEE